MMRKIETPNGTYINLDDAISMVKKHNVMVSGGDPDNPVSKAYSKAHDHIVELLEIQRDPVTSKHIETVVSKDNWEIG